MDSACSAVLTNTCLISIKESKFCFKLLVSHVHCMYFKAQLVIHPETSYLFSIYIWILGVPLSVDIWFCETIILFNSNLRSGKV